MRQCLSIFFCKPILKRRRTNGLISLLSRGGVFRPLAAIQFLAVIALFVSTTTHWAVVVLHRFGNLQTHPGEEAETFLSAFRIQACVGTATLTINVCRSFLDLYFHPYSHAYTFQIVLSDLIVWWRAWILWSQSRIVHVCGIALLLATFGESSELELRSIFLCGIPKLCQRWA